MEVGKGVGLGVGIAVGFRNPVRKEQAKEKERTMNARIVNRRFLFRAGGRSPFFGVVCFNILDRGSQFTGLCLVSISKKLLVD